MVENPVNGQVYWYIRQSMESEAYGDYSPVEPWLGKYKLCGLYAPVLSAVDDEGVADEDTNATAIISSEGDLFLTHREAAQQYIKYKTDHIKSQISNLDSQIEDLERFIRDN